MKLFAVLTIRRGKINQLSAVQWYLLIGYTGVGWSFTLYLEQLFTADLFLWYEGWEQAVDAAEHGGEKPPPVSDVPRSTLLDDVASLDERTLPGDSAPLGDSDGTLTLGDGP